MPFNQIKGLLSLKNKTPITNHDKLKMCKKY